MRVGRWPVESFRSIRVATWFEWYLLECHSLLLGQGGLGIAALPTCAVEPMLGGDAPRRTL
eukprot:9529802-Alexandrium_andersonii.AAC.1